MRHPKISTLTILSNQVEKGRNDVMKYFGHGWHADSSYKAVTAAATMLLGTEIPEQGGETLFANVEAAYDDLPEHEKSFLRKLRATNTAGHPTEVIPRRAGYSWGTLNDAIRLISFTLWSSGITRPVRSRCI